MFILSLDKDQGDFLPRWAVNRCWPHQAGHGNFSHFFSGPHAPGLFFLQTPCDFPVLMSASASWLGKMEHLPGQEMSISLPFIFSEASDFSFFTCNPSLKQPDLLRTSMMSWTKHMTAWDWSYLFLATQIPPFLYVSVKEALGIIEICFYSEWLCEEIIIP